MQVAGTQDTTVPIAAVTARAGGSKLALPLTVPPALPGAEVTLGPRPRGATVLRGWVWAFA